MGTTAPHVAILKGRSISRQVAARPASASSQRSTRASTLASNAGVPTASTLFRVPFASAMSDADVALLTRELDLTTDMHPKLHPSAVHPGFTRIDFYSGLFLEHGTSEGHWVLEARTWGNPPSWFIHDWHLRAAAAAHRLDPTVVSPGRASAATREEPSARLGRAAGRRRPRLASLLWGLR